MKKIALGGSQCAMPAIGLGCMRLTNLNERETAAFLSQAIELGVNFFDHADIYGKGECEKLFAKGMKAAQIHREDIILQSKCGIRQGEYNFTKEYILNSVDGILSRLQTDYLDLLLLHRPDALMIPEEVAEAFDRLHSQGKVRWFGVSNQNPSQIELLQSALSQRLLVNQLQFSLTNCGMVRSGMNVNQENNAGIGRDGDVLNYCRLNKITIQAWSPFQYGMFAGSFLDSEQYPQLNKALEALAHKYNVAKSAVAIAWILRHPSNMQVLLGTTNVSHLRDACRAADFQLTHQEWYDLYLAAGNILS